ncbi:SGNH/GDSL hydrolase family protein [Lutibacter flavus]|uniref:GDSL-like Lipase/Acylhydrolase n=1 Tax=Lutibacter flavus TaxID=691689 RepID=A0A238V9V2_9FLAO|nr:SGNH/GDSL hydrolase family protein [Lutibacter flavus]SNR31180.1 GDSL-like Lipase/Acylhydrolase [Lutibacter flavus]
MKARFIVPILLLTLIGCTKKSNSILLYKKANNSSFSYQGRTDVLKDSSVALISSAASVEFIVEGDSINLHLQSGNNSHNYIVVSINDEYQKRFKIDAKSITSIPLSLPKTAQNKIGIFKATEAGSGNVIFHGVEAAKISPIINDKEYFIEFIGDSVTCGAAADPNDVPCGTGEYLDQHNAYLAFGPRIARALNVNFMLSSVSGIGIYRNWNDENIEEPIMPQVYNNLYLNTDATKKYDFSIKPAIVNICLGTNDLSNGDGIKTRLPFNKEKFVLNYIEFVKTVYSHYPNTKIVLLNSPMIIGETNDLLVSCLNEVQNYFSTNTDKKVTIFQLDKAYNSGCTTHPNVEEHKEIAEKLTPFFKNLLNNK